MKDKYLRERSMRFHQWLTNPFVQSIIRGRSVFIVLLFIIQILLFLIFIVWLSTYLEFLLAVGLIASLSFFIFLVNKNEKNEYKIAWMIPISIFPLFGIGFYILVHVQNISSKIKKGIERAEKSDSKAILDSRYIETKQPFPEICDIVTYLRDSAAYPPYSHCAVDYYPSGEASFSDMIKDLRAAKKFIFIEYFAIFPGEMWTAILETLIKKAKAGVDVRVIYDGFGCIPIEPRSYQRYLTSCGIKAAIFVPIVPVFTAYLNNRDHRKICVIDGEYAFTGGINLSDQYINKTHKYGYWKDTVVRISGVAVRSFSDMFLRLWDIVTNSKSDFNNFLNVEYRRYDVPGLVIPYSDNAYNKDDVAENVYLWIINNAKRYVHITTPYVILDNRLLHALTFAVRRGVEVELLVPHTIDHFITFCMGRTYIKTLVDRGVHVYEFSPGFIHAKMFIADDESAVVGSINLDYRSLYDQFEDAVFMYKVPVVETIERDFQDTKKQCAKITAEVYKKTPLVRRIIGRTMRIFAPLL